MGNIEKWKEANETKMLQEVREGKSSAVSNLLQWLECRSYSPKDIKRLQETLFAETLGFCDVAISEDVDDDGLHEVERIDPTISKEEENKRIYNAIEAIKEHYGIDAFTDDKEIEQRQSEAESKAESKKRGRKYVPFHDNLQGTEAERQSRLSILNKCIDGKRNKQAVLCLKAAMALGWITRPQYKAVVAEFGEITTRSNYDYFMSRDVSKEDIAAIIEDLKAAEE